MRPTVLVAGSPSQTCEAPPRARGPRAARRHELGQHRAAETWRTGFPRTAHERAHGGAHEGAGAGPAKRDPPSPPTHPGSTRVARSCPRRSCTLARVPLRRRGHPCSPSVTSSERPLPVWPHSQAKAGCPWSSAARPAGAGGQRPAETQDPLGLGGTKARREDPKGLPPRFSGWAIVSTPMGRRPRNLGGRTPRLRHTAAGATRLTCRLLDPNATLQVCSCVGPSVPPPCGPHPV